VGRVAVVTGGGSGIGRAICEHLERDGHRVAALDLHEGPDVIPVDVADRASVEAAYERVRAELGPIEILVTSAGVAPFTPVLQIPAEEWDRVLAVNLTGTFHCIQAAVPDMLAGGWGRIVTISSVAGQTGSPGQVHYAASKGGVIALTKGVARELASRGVTANSIPPFVVDTPMFRDQVGDGKALSPEAALARVPAGRLGTPDDIAVACAFLCSEAAGYITGQVLSPNGGGHV
jgi:NAD(P)-dependent dehydrogenase (short-subunit alcohol dehydrogenase family)